MVRVVAFDCDGVLVDSMSSWRTIHNHFGTESKDLYARFIAGDIDDSMFMRSDIERWKEAASGPIHRDDLARIYSGCKLMPGMRDLVSTLREKGIFVAIISAGVDLFVGMVAEMLKVDDWVANGFAFDEDGHLEDEGIVRVPAKSKDQAIRELFQIHGFHSSDLASVGDTQTDLSMQRAGGAFFGFNPPSSVDEMAFLEAGFPVFEREEVGDLQEAILLS